MISNVTGTFMKTFREYLLEAESKSFSNWVVPSDSDIALEYKVEYDIKPLKRMTNDAFPTVEDFKQAVANAKVIKLTPDVDDQIDYRAKTFNKAGAIKMIQQYASYPKYRNEETIEAIYQGFANNSPMKMPLVLNMPDGSMRIMSGNTRTNIAMELGITPSALLIDVPAV
jgi:hypothetical protein